jgi:hypothetical protein
MPREKAEEVNKKSQTNATLEGSWKYRPGKLYLRESGITSNKRAHLDWILMDGKEFTR